VPGAPGGGGLQKEGAGTLILRGAYNFPGYLFVSGGTVLLNGAMSNNAGLFCSSGLTKLGADQDVKSLSVFKATAFVDLNGRTLRVFDIVPGLSLPTYRTWIATEGDPTGIFDSTTNASTAVGYGQVDATHVLFRKTLAGDANLDLKVDFTDLVALAQNYNTPTGKIWTSGDFTYDGAVDFNDLVKLAQNYNVNLLPGEPIPGAAVGFEQDLARAFASVPEPGAVLYCGLVACVLARGRRRRRVPASE
jgi:autotransporter-associated beta strand protein